MEPRSVITPEHEQQVLLPRGLTAADVEPYGVNSVEDITTVPGFENHRYAKGSGLTFTWRSPLKGDVIQFRPDSPERNDDGDIVKYVFAAGQEMVLNRLRETGDGPLLLAEGTCQGLAAAVYTHAGWSVYSMSGCWSWRAGDAKVATPDLMVVEGRDVVVALDADASTNLNVYRAGEMLAKALKMEGAHSVRFLQLEGHGERAGLDDVLGSRPLDKRASWLERQLASQAEMPATKAPKAKASSRPDVRGAAAGRPVIVCNEDRYEVINQLTEALRSRWSGTELFSYGGALARRRDAEMKIVTKPVQDDLIAEATLCINVSAKGEAVAAWPDERVRDAVLARHDRFAPMDRVAQVPFVRADGTIAQDPGYDETSRTYLYLDESMAVDVPQEPTPEDVQSAVKLLCDEWLGDLMAIMPEQSDRANALALVLTPLIRGLVPLAPMAVVDGLQMGVGKNLLADLVSIFAVGKPAQPLPYNREDEENRKVITSSFRAGHDLLVFDEAHNITGTQLARAITSITYTDRLLGGSTMLEFINSKTWIALGNNVSVAGDLSRRVYRIRLAPKVDNPHDRDVQSYRHPNIKEWTAAHRDELVAAGLTLVRAWFAAGQDVTGPSAAAGRRFASFEAWASMVGGVLDHAGISGFLGNLAEWRSETDYETSWWVSHLRWLRDKFGSKDFTTHEVVTAMKKGGQVEHPPRLENHEDRGYNRQLGMAYGRVKGRVMEGLQLVKTADSPGHGNRWLVVDKGDAASNNGPVPVTPRDTRRSTIVSSDGVTDSGDTPNDAGVTTPMESDQDEAPADTPLPAVDQPSTDGDNARSDIVFIPNVDQPSTQSDNARSDTVSVESGGIGGSSIPLRGEKSSYIYNVYADGENQGNQDSATPLSTRVYEWQPLTGADPLSSLLPLCAPVPARECPDDDQPEELTPDGLTYACRTCHAPMWE
jgi:hypothetical protein